MSNQPPLNDALLKEFEDFLAISKDNNQANVADSTIANNVSLNTFPLSAQNEEDIKVAIELLSENENKFDLQLSNAYLIDSEYMQRYDAEFGKKLAETKSLVKTLGMLLDGTLQCKDEKTKAIGFRVRGSIGLYKRMSS
jgi:hypothetical protein